jgi:hypothetical protein
MNKKMYVFNSSFIQDGRAIAWTFLITNGSFNNNSDAFSHRIKTAHAFSISKTLLKIGNASSTLPPMTSDIAYQNGISSRYGDDFRASEYSILAVATFLSHRQVTGVYVQICPLQSHDAFQLVDRLWMVIHSQIELPVNLWLARQ